ncbi:MAG: hypothetical protein RLZZ593_1322, partial [Bacteroidota bacterium]
VKPDKGSGSLEVPPLKTRKPLYNKDLRVFSFPEGAPGGARQG